ncbi:hypothetical protein PMIN06_009163 [Paraphaeosphaeria minitans]
MAVVAQAGFTEAERMRPWRRPAQRLCATQAAVYGTKPSPLLRSSGLRNIPDYSITALLSDRLPRRTFATPAWSVQRSTIASRACRTAFALINTHSKTHYQCA